MKCRDDEDEDETLAESPMAKPANQDPSAIISCDDPDPDVEPGSDPVTTAPDPPNVDPAMFGSDPDSDPSSSVDGVVVVGAGSFDDF